LREKLAVQITKHWFKCKSAFVVDVVAVAVSAEEQRTERKRQKLDINKQARM
jgi:hypothetical protein